MTRDERIDAWLTRRGWENVSSPPPRWEPPDAYALGISGGVRTWRAVAGQVAPITQPRFWRRLRRREARR